MKVTCNIKKIIFIIIKALNLHYL